MEWIFLFVVILAVILLVGHLGIPEKSMPMPPPPDPSRILPGAEPYRMEGDSGVAFIITHGYNGSPFDTRPLGEYLNQQGHTSIGVLLPGHGTTIEDMTKARFAHWVEHLENIYLRERNRYEKLFLIGFSMGGTVTLAVAGRNADSSRPTGIVTISSPVFFNGFFNGRLVLHQPATVLTGVIQIFQDILNTDKERPPSYAKINPWVGYGGANAVRALHSFKRNFGGVRNLLDRITSPYCSIQAANDRTVAPQNQMYIYDKIASRQKRAYTLVLPPDLTTMHSLITHHFASAKVFDYVKDFVEDILGEEVIEPPKSFWKDIRDFFKRFARRRAKKNSVPNEV